MSDTFYECLETVQHINLRLLKLQGDCKEGKQRHLEATNK
jgi:hypothetical protein